MNYPKLYSRDSKGKIRVWSVEIDGAKYRQHHGLLDGKIVTTAFTEAKAKNINKANETTPEEQAKLEVDALIVKQLKSNYFEDIKDVDKGYLEPQLAKPCKKYIDKVKWEDGQIVDDKLNGICCQITKKGAFSRENEEFFAIPHIKQELEIIIEKFPEAFFHGELFNFAYVTQLDKIAEIVSVVRKEKDITPELLAESKRMVEYHLYDGYGFWGIKKEDNGLDRRTHLEAFIKANKFKYIKCVNWDRLYSFKAMEERFNKYVATGGEGVIIRNPKASYQHSRTKDLLKFKKSESAEFEVIEIEEGDADWKGCAKAVWCKLPNGKRTDRFKSNIKGEREHLRKVFNEKEKYKGEMITVDFQEYSSYGVPLIPYTDMLIRNYE